MFADMVRPADSNGRCAHANSDSDRPSDDGGSIYQTLSVTASPTYTDRESRRWPTPAWGATSIPPGTRPPAASSRTRTDFSRDAELRPSAAVGLSASERHRNVTVRLVRRTARVTKSQLPAGQSYYWDVIALSAMKPDFPTSYKSSSRLLTATPGQPTGFNGTSLCRFIVQLRCFSPTPALCRSPGLFAYIN